MRVTEGGGGVRETFVERLLTPLFVDSLSLCPSSVSQSVQFSSRWYLSAQKSPYALHLVSQKFSQRCL